jgi:hypothetical protein
MAMTVRPDELLDRAITELAEAAHTSKQEAIRTAVLEKWEREGHRARVAKSGDRMLTRWGGVLDRLAGT